MLLVRMHFTHSQTPKKGYRAVLQGWHHGKVPAKGRAVPGEAQEQGRGSQPGTGTQRDEDVDGWPTWAREGETSCCGDYEN